MPRLLRKRASTAEVRYLSGFLAHIRSLDGLTQAVQEAKVQFQELETRGCKVENATQAVQALRNRQLCFAHWIYLEATLFAVKSGVGSRGSAMVQDDAGTRAHPQLDKAQWSFAEEKAAFKDEVQETVFDEGEAVSRWVKVRPIPESNLWFETAWADFRAGKIYK